MTTYNLVDDLKRANLKVTPSRKQIMQILSAQPMSAQEVKDALSEKGFNVDLVTVYRTLDLFNSLELVRKTEFEDHVARFELVGDQEHHHHLVCIKCGLIEDIVVNENKFVKEIEEQSQFKVQRHALEFFGFCKNCQK